MSSTATHFYFYLRPLVSYNTVQLDTQIRIWELCASSPPAILFLPPSTSLSFATFSKAHVSVLVLRDHSWMFHIICGAGD